MYKAILRDRLSAEYKYNAKKETSSFHVVMVSDDYKEVLSAGRRAATRNEELIITENDKVIWREMRA